jgi:hypothetical protein
MASKKSSKAIQQEQEQLVDIRRFEPDRMKQHKIILIIGPQYSGKSWLLKDLLYYVNPSFPVLVNPNEFATGFYGGILPKQCKKERLDNDWLEKFCGRQRQLLDFNRQNRRNLDCSAGLILDHFTGDLTRTLKWHLNPYFKFLFQSGKDACTTLVVTSPYPLKLPPDYLAAVDYVFMLRETNKTNKQALFKMFGGMFGTYENFEDIFDQCTINYRALVIDRTKRTGEISDQVFWYRAPKRPRRFRMGSPRLWSVCYNTSVSLEDLLTKPLMLYEASSNSSDRRRERRSYDRGGSTNPYAARAYSAQPQYTAPVAYQPTPSYPPRRPRRPYDRSGFN